MQIPNVISALRRDTLTSANDAGCRALGFNMILSLLIALVVNGTMSYATLPVSTKLRSMHVVFNLVHAINPCLFFPCPSVLYVFVVVGVAAVPSLPDLRPQHPQEQAWQ